MTHTQKTDKLQHSFTIKPLSKLGIEGNYLNSIKNIYKPPYSYIILNGDKWMLSPSDQEQGKEVYYSCNLFNIVVEFSASAIRQGNETAGDWKGRNYTVPFTDDMMVWIRIKRSLQKNFLD